MKYKCLLVILGLTLLQSNVSAQEFKPTNDHVSKHELKINLPYLLFPVVDIAYEYGLNDFSGIGVDAIWVINDSHDIKGGILPYYRAYFSSKRNEGFFVELNLATGIYEDREYDPVNGEVTKELEPFFGVGCAVGWKFVNRNDLIGEAVLGIGRATGIDEIYPRLGIMFGKRF